MNTTKVSDYAGPYKRIQPESELEKRTLVALIRSELPTRWQDHGVYTRPSMDDEGRMELIVSPSATAGDPMEMDLTEYKGTAYALQNPSGEVKVAWTLVVDGQEQSNLLPHEPTLPQLQN